MPHHLVSVICPFCIHRIEARQSEAAVTSSDTGLSSTMDISTRHVSFPVSLSSDVEKSCDFDAFIHDIW